MLVHDAQAVMGEPLDEAAGCLRLVGTVVQAADGRYLGRVRPPACAASVQGAHERMGGRLAVVCAVAACVSGTKWGVANR